MEIPTLLEVIEFLREQSVNARLFSGVPIGTGAIVCLECTVDGWTLHASCDRDDIDCASEAYEAWDELYLADTNAELRATAHRMISTIRDGIMADENFQKMCLTGIAECGTLLDNCCSTGVG